MYKCSNIILKFLNFKYYLGYEKKGKFIVQLDRDIIYNMWYEFIEADYEDFEIYYSSLPQASNNDMDIVHANLKKIILEQTFDTANVYIRVISPTVLEYVVAEEEEINEGSYLSEIITINLG